MSNRYIKYPNRQAAEARSMAEARRRGMGTGDRKTIMYYQVLEDPETGDVYMVVPDGYEGPLTGQERATLATSKEIGMRKGLRLEQATKEEYDAILAEDDPAATLPGSHLPT